MQLFQVLADVRFFLGLLGQQHARLDHEPKTATTRMAHLHYQGRTPVPRQVPRY
jgi:hypothetical protein